MLKNRINIAVAGATGYVGLDLVYLLTKHPKVKLLIYMQKNIGKNISFLTIGLKKLPKITNIKNLNWRGLIFFFYHYQMEKHKN